VPKIAAERLERHRLAIDGEDRSQDFSSSITDAIYYDEKHQATFKRGVSGHSAHADLSVPQNRDR
jgi:hypothetical protein